MVTQLRLGSVVPHGVGGPEAGALDLIYLFLLMEHGLNAYKFIFINQIGDDLNEVIIKQGKEIYVNVQYPASNDFELKSDDDKNRIRLDVIHTGLLRIAAKEKKLDIQILERIKNKILENNFSFEFEYKRYINTKNKNLIAKLIIHPKKDSFQYYIQIEKQGKVKCKQPIYNGLTNTFYVDDLFKTGKWKNDTSLIITGAKKEVEIHLTVENCEVKYKNLTTYENPPRFQLFRTDITAEEKEKAKEDWHHSLPPAIAAIIRDANN